MPMTNIDNATLLIVDDIPTNLKMLLAYLRDLNFKLLIAQDGEDALAKAAYAKPDLILLDIMMPRMDGFETCRRLKQHEETRDIPVIFMTALTETVDKVKGFQIGAVDYIAKPVQHEEVLARVNTHLTLRNLQKITEQQSLAFKQQALDLQEQNKELDAFSKLVVQNLKKPLGALSVFTKILLKDLAHLPNKEPLKFLQEVERSREKMARATDELVLLANVRTQEITMEAPDMMTITNQVRNNLSPMLDEYQAKLSVPDNWPIVWGYSPWIEKTWTTYISNAMKRGGKPPRLELGATPAGEKHVRFWVKDNGPGLSSEQQERLFMPFTTIEPSSDEDGYALELSIVRLLIEKCGGQVGVYSQTGGGSTFYFTLPTIG